MLWYKQIRELDDIYEASSCDEKDEDTPEEVMLAKISLKELWETFHNTKNTKKKMLEADPNFRERVNLSES